MSLVFPVLTEPVPAPPNKRGAGPNLPIRTSGEPGGTRTRDPMIKSSIWGHLLSLWPDTLSIKFLL